jgi:segregation and condensation protein B
MDELVTPHEQDVESTEEAPPAADGAPQTAPEAGPPTDAEPVPPDQTEEAAPAENSTEEAVEAVPAEEVPEDQAAVSMDELLGVEPNSAEGAPGEVTAEVSQQEMQLRAVLEAIIYVAEEPVTPAQVAAALQLPIEHIRAALAQLAEEYEKREHGIAVREVAGGYKMATKAEHHETVRSFVKSLKPPLKLSLPALETLAVIAYKQPVTAPEIMEIRGVQGAGVLKTLLDRKLIATAGRKNVIGKPILYRTTKEFLIQFGLKDLAELPSLKEFEEIRRLAFADGETPAADAPGTGESPAPEAAEAEQEPELEAQEPEPEAQAEEGSQVEAEEIESAPAEDAPAGDGPAAPEPEEAN